MSKNFYTAALLVLFVFTSLTSWSQSSVRPLQELVNKKLAAKQSAVKSLPLFSLSPNVALKSSYQPKELSAASFLSLDQKALLNVLNTAPEILEFKLQAAEGDLDLILVKQDVVTSDFTVITDASNEKPIDYNAGVHYRGVINGQPTSLAAISVFDNEVMGMIATDEGNYNLGKLSANDYILYNDHKLDVKRENFCGVEDVPVSKKFKEIDGDRMKSAGKCVRVYVETDFDLFQNKGSAQNVTNYITGLFNQVAILYQNESISTQLSQVFVWTSADPYSGSSSSNYLTGFRTTRTSFNGDLAHLVNITGNLGGVAYLDVLCNSGYRYAFSSIYANYSNVPTYSWSVEVFTHEMGHNLGSPHTQSCTWPGGAIDDCYTTEGGCAPGPKPTNGGTIMSYCHLTSTGINFNNGFGPLPGDRIRTEVNGAACLTTCDGGGTPVCNVPTGLSSGSISQTGFTVSWAAASGAVSYDVQYRKQGTTTWTVTTSSTTSKAISGLTAATTYEFQVRSVCGTAGTSAYSAIGTATTSSVVISYCASKGTNVSAEWIAGVRIGSINNTSGSNAGYGNFTNLSATLVAGSTNQITLTPGFKNGGLLGTSKQTKPEIWRVWIDYNRDGDFTDAGETVFAPSTTATVAVSANITVPAGTAAGSTRMRVAMKRSAAATSCETFTYGEVEDYTIVISLAMPSTGKTEAAALSVVKELGLKLYPNPSNGIANVAFELSAEMGATSLEVYDITGKRLAVKNFDASQGDSSIQHEFDLSTQAKGVYFVSIATANGIRKVEKLVLN